MLLQSKEGALAVRDPFAIHNVLLHLTEYQLQLLINLLARSNPSGADEGFVVQTHIELSEILDRIRKNET